MSQLKIFIELTRLTALGFMLLFWPCSWGLASAFKQSKSVFIFIHLILFFLGSVLMRSAGCIVNDIVDKDYDKKVEDKLRPLAAGKISVKNHCMSLFYVFLHSILIQFNFFTILLGLGSMFFAFTYPFMKRITYWPQLFFRINI